MSVDEFYLVRCRLCENNFESSFNSYVCQEGNVMIRDGKVNIIDKNISCPKYTEHKKEILNKKIKKIKNIDIL